MKYLSYNFIDKNLIIKSDWKHIQNTLIFNLKEKSEIIPLFMSTYKLLAHACNQQIFLKLKNKVMAYICSNQYKSNNATVSYIYGTI